MQAKDFVARVTQAVVDDNQDLYRDTFANANLEHVSDDYWKKALQLYRKLDDGDRRVFLEVTRQVALDTLSNVFAVLDGISQLEGQEGDFELVVDDETREPLNGDLQDILLELEERKQWGSPRT